jgi:hypothetical protein
VAVEAYAYGSPLVVDPGRYTYAEGTPNWRHWFKGTGGAQHRDRGRPRPAALPARQAEGPQLSSRLLDLRAAEGLHLLRGEVTSPAYDAVHRRAVVFVGGEYWLVFDELRACRAARLRAALAPGRRRRCRTGRQRRRAFVATTPTVRLEIAGGVARQIEAGWLSTSTA